MNFVPTTQRLEEKDREQVSISPFCMRTELDYVELKFQLPLCSGESPQAYMVGTQKCRTVILLPQSRLNRGGGPCKVIFQFEGKSLINKNLVIKGS